MSARKKKAGAPMTRRWLTAVQQDEELSKVAVHIAAAMFLFADNDGRHCYPSVETIVRRSRYTERWVRIGISDLTSAGYLKLARKANQHRPNEYALLIPETAETVEPTVRVVVSATPDAAQGGSECNPCDEPGVTPGVAPGVALTTPYLRPPSDNEEEEESASARFADASLAALSTNPESFPDLFSDAEAERAEDAADGEESETAVWSIARHIAEGGRVPIDARRIGKALLEAQARTGWSDLVLATYCVDKLRHGGRRIREASAFLATDLGRVNGDTMLTPRMRLAVMYDRLDALDDKLDCAGRSESVAVTFEQLQIEAGLLDENALDPLQPWDVKDTQLKQAEQLAHEALYSVKDPPE
jgi:hypothetical protein